MTYNALYMQELHGRILRWGNSYGVRITKAEAERLGLHEGDDVDLLVQEAHGDVPEIPTFDLGGLADDHDRLFGEAAARDLDEGR